MATEQITSMASRTQSFWGRVLAVGGAAAGLVGSLNDFFTPLVPFAPILVPLLILLAISLSAINAITPIKARLCACPAPDMVCQLFRQYWCAPMVVTLLTMATALWGFAQWTEAHKDKGGVIAETVPGAASLQESLGIMDRHLQSIAADSRRTADAVQSIDRKMDGLKKETSDDPQKELANRGLAWTNDAFGDAVLRGDVAAVRLYFQAGWTPRSTYKQDGRVIGAFVWSGDMSNEATVAAILDAFLAAGLRPDEPVAFRGLPPMGLGEFAVRACNLPVVRHLLKIGGFDTAPLRARAEQDKAVAASHFPRPLDCQLWRPDLNRLLKAQP